MLLDLLLALPCSSFSPQVVSICSAFDNLSDTIMFYVGTPLLTYFKILLEVLWSWLQTPEILGSEIDYLTTRGEKILARIDITPWSVIFDIIFTPTVIYAINISFKFILGIVCLIFARGGIPRFRFDYLTKLGWIRFLSVVLVSFLLQILILAVI